MFNFRYIKSGVCGWPQLDHNTKERTLMDGQFFRECARQGINTFALTVRDQSFEEGRGLTDWYSLKQVVDHATAYGYVIVRMSPRNQSLSDPSLKIAQGKIDALDAPILNCLETIVKRQDLKRVAFQPIAEPGWAKAFSGNADVQLRQASAMLKTWHEHILPQIGKISPVTVYLSGADFSEVREIPFVHVPEGCILGVDTYKPRPVTHWKYPWPDPTEDWRRTVPEDKEKNWTAEYPHPWTKDGLRAYYRALTSKHHVLESGCTKDSQNLPFIADQQAVFAEKGVKSCRWMG